MLRNDFHIHPIVITAILLCVILSFRTAAQWNGNPAVNNAICTATDYQLDPQICSDGSGGAIITWQDYRGTPITDIYTSKVNSSGQLVPVELVSFSGRLKGNTVTLTWKTATEVSNYGFEVERKSSARIWEAIGFIAGSGTSNTPKTYLFQDRLNSYGLHVGRILYRLRQIDRDGSYEYSPVVEVRLHEMPTSPTLRAPYPNPAKDQIVVPITLTALSPVVLRIINSAGMEVVRMEYGGLSGGAYHALPVSTAGLPSGTYMVEMVAGQVRKTQKVTVRR